MIELYDNELLYHASYSEIRKIDLGKCRKGLDFGRGFYVTSSYEQAKSYVSGAVKKAVRMKTVPDNFTVNDGIINIFRFHICPNLRIHYFEAADADWLHFVAANRDSSLFPDLFKKYRLTDIIGGKIANDNTARTLGQYVAGAYGIPGEERADNITLEMLLPNRLQDQFCFRTDEATASLEFVRSERYGDIK